MKPGVTAIIATLFHPPTLGPLVDAFRRDGAHVEVIEGKRTNVAWQAGLDRCETRNVMIANDDIEVYPKQFIPRLLDHHHKGYTFLVPTMWRGLNVVGPLWAKQEADGSVTSMQKKGLGPGWAQRGVLLDEEPMDKGHFMSMDRVVPVPRIPEELTILYGDDWFYWHHMKMGRCGIALDVSVRTGYDLDYDGFRDGGQSSFTQDHPDLDKVLDEPWEDIVRREHKLARKYLSFYAPEGVENEWGWRGFSSGVKRSAG